MTDSPSTTVMTDEVIYRLMKVVHDIYWDARVPLKIRGVDLCWVIVQRFNAIHDLPGRFVMDMDKGRWMFQHHDGRTLRPYGLRWYHANTGEVLEAATLARPND